MSKPLPVDSTLSLLEVWMLLLGCQGLDFLLLLLHTRLPNLGICVHPQNHGWQVGNCTAKLPFMCQRKGKIEESKAQPGCDPKDVSSGFSVCLAVCINSLLFSDVLQIKFWRNFDLFS